MTGRLRGAAAAGLRPLHGCACDRWCLAPYMSVAAAAAAAVLPVCPTCSFGLPAASLLPRRNWGTRVLMVRSREAAVRRGRPHPQVRGAGFALLLGRGCRACEQHAADAAAAGRGCQLMNNAAPPAASRLPPGHQAAAQCCAVAAAVAPPLPLARLSAHPPTCPALPAALPSAMPGVRVPRMLSKTPSAGRKKRGGKQRRGGWRRCATRRPGCRHMCSGYPAGPALLVLYAHSLRSRCCSGSTLRSVVAAVLPCCWLVRRCRRV